MCGAPGAGSVRSDAWAKRERRDIDSRRLGARSYSRRLGARSYVRISVADGTRRRHGMAQSVATPEDTGLINADDDIRAVLQLYMDGSAKGDVSKLRDAFHPESRMFGSLDGKRVDIPIEAFFELAAQGPADTAGRYRGRVLSVAHVGDAATAIVGEDGFWGSVSFV